MRSILYRLLIVGFCLHVSAGAEAGELLRPEGETVLTIGGHIANSNGDGVVAFDMAMLEALDAESIVTKTPWTNGDVTFVGVDLAKLMAHVGADGETLTVTALNDYQITIPMADLAAFHPILAYRRDGQYMPVSDKGPLFIVYPFDSDPQLQADVYYSRAAWQVASMTID